MRIDNIGRHLLAGIFSLALAACGGGGGGSSRDDAPKDGPDPLFSQQWHLRNLVQAGGSADQDLNVMPVWASCGDASCRGEGVRVAVVDDGLEIAHEDLRANVVSGASYNYVPGGDPTNPTPSNGDDFHGTAVAGIVAARDDNGVGGRGVAPRAELVGYNLLQDATSANQADAMTRGADSVDVSTTRWGAPDGTGNLQGSDFNWRTGIETGIAAGRGGLGIVYVWAAGNGGRFATSKTGVTLPVDNSNYDGQANFYGVMAIAALDPAGKKSSYSEPGANIWISAPGGESCRSGDGIVTADLMGRRGLNGGSAPDLPDPRYTRCMNGTSSAAPMVAGVAALVLQANPALSWRDVKLILAESARRTDPEDADWIRNDNGTGFWVNHKYGFGAVDAAAAVTLAKGWTPLPAMVTYPGDVATVNQRIPDGNDTGVSDTVTISGSGISQIEFVEVYFSAADHTYSGDLEITLTNVTTRTSSVLAETHLCACQGAEFAHDNWRFGTARHLGEGADGDWQLTVKDKHGKDVGTFQSWRLVFHGR